MLLQDKKGVSIMVGYILLIVGALVMGGLVYQGLKTYVPTEIIDCPEGVSIFIKEKVYDGNNLKITLVNNGFFNINGYFIHATTTQEQKVATLDLSEFIKEGGIKGGGFVLSLFEPNDEKPSNFEGIDIEIYSIQIIPMRFQKEDSRKRFVACGNSKINEDLNHK